MSNTSVKGVDKKYILSPFYSFVDPNEKLKASHNQTQNETISKIEKGELKILQNNYLGKSYLVNQTIYRFLTYFISPKPISDLISDFAKEVKCEEIEITPHINQFLSKMTHRSILIQDIHLDSANEFLAKNNKDIKDRAIYKVNDQFKQYSIKRVLSLRKNTQLFILEHEEQLSVLKILALPDEMPEKVKESHKNKFKKEFKMLDLMKEHPAICKLYHFDEKSKLYAIMELIKGISLKKFITGKQHPLQFKITLLASVIDIIAFIQDKGILHGDIHSSNFIVDEKNEVKLIDFGLSNNVEYEEGEIIRNGGKSDFIPPERVSFNSFKFLSRPPDIQSEVFQLGVLGYFILYQKMPFAALTWNELAHNIKTLDPVFNKVCSSEEPIPQPLIQVLKKAMNKEPEMRYANARLLSNAIKMLINEK